MLKIWLIAAFAQCLLLWGLWRGARGIILQKDRAKAPETLPDNVPVTAMIIPAAGNHPAMPDALRTLLRQDYPNLLPVIVTGTEEDPATALTRQLQLEFPTLEHVTAGPADLCGQKNHNTLKALAHVGTRADIYLFCDSTHTAAPDFVRQLVWPIVSGEAAFTTGYHNVHAQDDAPVTLGYQVSVLLMRFFQAVAVFTQPWGGAMAMARQAFERHDIAGFWRNNVVDDCSLAGMLMQRRLHVQLCPYAILTTTARAHRMEVWRAWMERQVLFLKFCVPSQWWLLGVFAALVALPTVFSLLFVLGGLTNALPHSATWVVLAAAVHLGLLSLITLGWRELLPRPTPALRWLGGFALGIGMFFMVYLRTIRCWTIDWHGMRYYVGKGGKVLNTQRLG